jgi:sulfatase maturation enzyme AslB (radical SAM superfamily)
VLTHRCNHGCQYCHSSIVGMERYDTDMSIETAERAVDSPSRRPRGR